MMFGKRFAKQTHLQVVKSHHVYLNTYIVCSKFGSLHLKCDEMCIETCIEVVAHPKPCYPMNHNPLQHHRQAIFDDFES